MPVFGLYPCLWHGPGPLVAPSTRSPPTFQRGRWGKERQYSFATNKKDHQELVSILRVPVLFFYSIGQREQTEVQARDGILQNGPTNVYVSLCEAL